MALILNLETSTKNCSVALGNENEILASREQHSDQYIHSEKLHLFIDEVMKEAGASFTDLDAVAVGRGPGSYTGLRIGVSAAKGFCYSLSIPLISEDGLKLLATNFLSNHSTDTNDVVVPMLDARRMEVYYSVYNHEGMSTQAIEAMVVDENSFSSLGTKGIHFIGDGAEKCRELLSREGLQFHDLKFPSAVTLNTIAQQKFEEKQFEDLAYFEPFYLKDFVAGKPKKLLP